MASKVKDATFSEVDNSITITYIDGYVIKQYFTSPTEAKEWLIEYGSAYGI